MTTSEKILGVVAVGGLAAYFLTRKPQTSAVCDQLEALTKAHAVYLAMGPAMAGKAATTAAQIAVLQSQCATA